MLSGVEVELIAGSAEDIVIPLTDDNDAIIPDLAGWTGTCQVRYAPGHATVLAQWSTLDGSLVLAGSAARLVISAARAEQALSWTWRLAQFDLVLTAPPAQDSLPNRPIRGVIRLVQGITR